MLPSFSFACWIEPNEKDEQTLFNNNKYNHESSSITACSTYCRVRRRWTVCQMLFEFRVINSSFRSVVIKYTCQRQWAMGDLIACGM